jgi:hypothetical protein
MAFRCYDRVPDPVLLDELARLSGTEEAAGDPALFWPVGSVLRVRFLDGPAELRRAVLAAAADWTAGAHISFAEVERGPAEIRVTFSGAGNWSALGTLALRTEKFPADGPTMCLSEAPGAPAQRVALLARHEFGHALGLIHEHSSPVAGIRWNKPVVYQELAGPPNRWDHRTVEENVFAAYAGERTQFTAFDPRSVMVYPIPAHWTLDGLTVAGNPELSPSDREFVARIYPRP